jgi:hypothetical protein
MKLTPDPAHCLQHQCAASYCKRFPYLRWTTWYDTRRLDGPGCMNSLDPQVNTGERMLLPVHDAAHSRPTSNTHSKPMIDAGLPKRHTDILDWTATRYGNFVQDAVNDLS